MKAIFIGSIYSEEKQVTLKKLGSNIDNAAHTFQSALLLGLSNYYDEIDVITIPNISSYPKCKKINFGEEIFSLNLSCKVNCIFTGLINLPIIKLYSKFRRIKKQLELAIKNTNEESVIYVYGVHTPFLQAVCKIQHSDIKTCLIVPDLPEFMSGNKNPFYLLAKKLDKILIDFCIKKFDSFVLLSPFMKERLPIGDKPWIQMEGIFQNTLLTEVIEKEKFKTILYTGNLGKRYGIELLLDAFSLIKSDDYRLWIRGNGETLAEVKERAKKDPRIIYFDQMSKIELLKLQKKATLLVNPVSPKQEFTRFFFPSKTMEYLASGTPTVMFRLDCLPKDYYKHLFFFEDDTAESMCNRLIEICSKSETELASFGKLASDFILNEKNAMVQTEKIFAMARES